MGKNLTGGNKQKSKKNHIEKPRSVPISQITPDEETTFIGLVTKKLGSCRFNVELFPTNTNINSLIPGSFQRKVYININDYVLVQKSDLGEKQTYILHKYDKNEIDELINIGKFKIKNDGLDDDLFREHDETQKDVEISLDDL